MGEWIGILAGLLGSTTLAGAASAFYFRRETKRIKKAEINKESAAAMKEDATAAKEMLELVLQGTTSLQTIYCHAVNPPHLPETSNPLEALGVPSSQTINVPAGSVSSYTSHPVWGLYNIMSI